MLETLAADPAYNPLALGAVGANSNVARVAIEQRRKKADVVEPRVISEELLIEGVEEPVKPDGGTWEPIEFPEVTSLRLSFLNIIEISNLCNFDSLLLLRLDNNIIDKIANLSHLTQLKWLDLSFNNIREIEGLEKLHQLLDLSLYHNQIEEIAGLDGCMSLNILSLGHNCIKDLKQIDNLRKFANLRCVCLDGNKVCQNASYNSHVLAYLPHLKFLDYMLIDRKAVAQAQEGYNLDEINEVREKEQVQATQLATAHAKKAVIEKLKTSFLDGTEDLFEELFGKDVEPENVTVLQNYAIYRDQFKESLLEDIKALRAQMEEKNEIRLRKLHGFEKAVSIAEKESEAEAFQMIRYFKSYLKKGLAKIAQDDASGRRDSEVNDPIKQLNSDLLGLESQLMANEIQLQESIEEALDEFKAKVEDIMKAMGELGADFFVHLQEHHRTFVASLTEGASTEIDAFQQNQDTSLAETDTTKARFLGQREDMTTAITNFNEAQSSMITNKEDAMTNAMNTWKSGFFEAHRERQYHRNRQRILDIKKVIDDCREEIDAARELAEYDDDHVE